MMKNTFYQLPLQMGRIINKQELNYCKRIEESIAQHIHLIILTNFGENRFDPNFGCVVWENDFDILPAGGDKHWITDITKTLTATIETYEKRIHKVNVKVSLDQIEFRDDSQKAIVRIKKRIKVSLEAKLKKTDEVFRFSDEIYFSPVALD